MSIRTLLGAFICLGGFLPMGVHAAGLSAGFAPGTVWVSQTNPAAGSTVKLYTVMYDGGSTAIEGSVSFLVDGTVVGSTPFSLEPGSSAIESVSWQATEGAHVVSAKITSIVDKKTKAALALEHTDTSTLSVTVGPAAAKPAALEALNSAQVTVASSSPFIQQAVTQTTSLTEGIRTAGLSYLTSLASATSTATTTRGGSVLGAQTHVSDDPTQASTLSWTQKAANALIPLFKYPALFYPLFVGVLCLLFWMLLKRLRNPATKRR